MEQLLLELNKLGVKLRLEGDDLRLSAPPGVLAENLRQQVRAHKQALIDLLRARREDAPPRLEADPAGRHHPFPLTALQHAYWVGRNAAVEMGDVATSLYVELDCAGMDLERLNAALCQVIERHEMLRAVIDGDGMQRILSDVPRYRIPVDDQSASAAGAADAALLRVRDELLGQVRPTDRWPLFDIRATLLPQGGLRLQISLDLLVLDASSIFYFFREWHTYYANPGHKPAPLQLSFRDCVLAEHAAEQGAAYRAAHAYWMERVDTLPAAPDLSLRADPATRQAPRFSRREARLDQARWSRLKDTARSLGVTAPNLLLAVYGEVLARWSAAPAFTVNVTVSNRPALHPEVDMLLGDFTSLIMHAVDRGDAGQSFLDFARQLQQRFLEDLSRREVSGVTVLREWARRHGGGLAATMPVVFSCGLIGSGDQEVGNIEQFGRKVFSVSQTAQVWLHLFVVEQNGDLVVCWDAVDAVFEPGVLDAMFGAYCELLERLESEDTLWHQGRVTNLPPAMLARREEANATSAACPEGAIHAGMVRHALACPDAPAVIAPEMTLSYGELLAAAAALADRLIQAGASVERPVAVLMRKGWEQVVAVYGALLAGCAYLPIDADLPPQRQLDLLRLGEVAHVLVQPNGVRAELNTDEWTFHTVRPEAHGAGYGQAHAATLDGADQRLAYIIFTSGTTGVPKGVMVDHASALNTLEHVNRALVGAGPGDRLLGVSSLSFDLSVYDIFGMHGAGATLVLPDVRKGHDPVHWCALLRQHGVTVWNSAPQLMHMLVDAMAGDAVPAPSLRKVLLSGDFIPLDLPDRIRMRAPAAEVISLGGATEAAIWSNCYRIGRVDPAWCSIPYGKPLPNQTMWVYDRALQARPDHVMGRIHIGGAGLARGYWRDPEKTAARFIHHPATGERLYDTGDLGYYTPDGNIVIVGRDDGQVKVRGHRIELGEIDAVLSRHAAVRQAVTVLAPGTQERRQLVAFVALDPAQAATPSAAGGLLQALQGHLAERLPDYMVPRQLLPVERIPLSSNGKVDLAILARIAEAASIPEDGPVAPRTRLEEDILLTWSRVITDCRIGVTDSFFELGGDSVLATLLVRELNAAMPVAIEMHELFENMTIESLAALYERRIADEDGLSAVPETAAMRDDVCAVVNQLSALGFDRTPPAGAVQDAPRAVLLTGATGWVGAFVLHELLARTDATIFCLVRAATPAAGAQRILDNLAHRGLTLASDAGARIVALCGDLALPRFGLDAAAWERVAAEAGAIFHLGGSASLAEDYHTARVHNLFPVVDVVRLALSGAAKRVHVLSPMTVCRRQVDGALVVHTEETAQDDPAGLATGYAQSKWALEQALLSAAGLGLPVRIYRTSHALPARSSGRMKEHDTYTTVLRAGCAAGCAPQWAGSALPGVPVDTLAALMVANALEDHEPAPVVHLENRDPADLGDVIGAMLDALAPDTGPARRVPVAEWMAVCRAGAATPGAGDASLARLLFQQHGTGTPVEHMFSAHRFATSHFERRGQAALLAGLTPPAYWRMLAGALGAPRAG